MSDKPIIDRAPVSGLAPGRPSPDSDPDEAAPPTPEKDWLRFDFKPGASPEQIAKILMESLARHSDDGEDDDGVAVDRGTFLAR